MQAQDTGHDLAIHDLGPLAWVLDELRKSLEASCSALRRFLREAAQAQAEQAEQGPVDSAQLRIARQHLHQALGALEMVGLRAPAQVLRAMEAALQAFVQRPQQCDDVAFLKIERAGLALIEFLEALLAGKQLSAVALFPQYRDVLALSGAERVHPADLWSLDWRWHHPELPEGVQPLAYAPALRSRMDQAVLRIVKSFDSVAALELSRITLGLAAAQPQRQARVFWQVCAAYFEAVALGRLPADLYVKRAASRVLVQYAQLAKGDPGVSERLAQDLVFFCGQAGVASADEAPLLHAVRRAWGLEALASVDYEREQFGRFDTAGLAQVRKRIAAAKDIWSQLAGGEPVRLRSCADHFRQLGEALVRLHPGSARLAKALQAVGEEVTQSTVLPAPELAMEVATAVLYLDAAFQDLDQDEAVLRSRAQRLAERLDRARQGGSPEALETWMEELYRRVSDRQTMGSVVGELRGVLGEIEKDLDAFFREPHERAPLQAVPARLVQMRGVLSVLGLHQADQAVLRMRAEIDALLMGSVQPPEGFETLGNNLGALGFLIDMLNYQPVLAKKLFVFDAAVGELRPLMGRAAPAERRVPRPAAIPADQRPGLPAPPAADASTTSAEQPVAQVTMPSAPDTPDTPDTAPDAAPDTGVDDELLEIFLEEAREVVQGASASLALLRRQPGELGELTGVRRAFHTLKGSSRMVGLAEFGEAAWALEQVFNAWLAEHPCASEDLLALAAPALTGFGRWVEDIAAGRDSGWRAAMFRTPADAFRRGEPLQPLVFPEQAEGAGEAPPAVLSDTPEMVDAAASAPASPSAEEPAVLDFDGFGEVEEVVLGGAEPLDDTPVAKPAELHEFEASIEPLAWPETADEPAEMKLSDAGVERTLHQEGLSSHDMHGLEVTEGQDDDALDAWTAAHQEPAWPQPVEAVAEPVAQPPGQWVGQALAEAPFAEAAFAEEAPPIEPLPSALELPELPATAAAAPEAPELAQAIDESSEPAPAVSSDMPEEARVADLPEVFAGEPAEEHVRVIGSLRIGIPLYNVYLNEADEWSRRLQLELSEWALETTTELPESAVAMAHSLAGSSATIGFHALSGVARTLEHALVQTRARGVGSVRHGAVYNRAAEEIRRLLHQFAAGFLKQPDLSVVQDLLALDTEPGTPAAAAPEVTTLPSTAAPVMRVVASLDDQRDGIDAVDAVDCDLFPIFEEEAAELLPQLGGALRQWHARPTNRSAREAVLRCLHTLKGSARLAGALRLGEMAHRLESLVEQVGADAVTEADIDPLLQRFDAMQSAYEQLRVPASHVPAEVEASGTPPEPAQPQETVPAPVAQAGGLAAPVSTSLAARRVSASQQVRVRSHLLDRLMNQAGEVMISRSRLEDELRSLRTSLHELTGNLERLRGQLRDVELQAEVQMQTRLAQAKDSTSNFDPLEFDRFTRMQELTRMMAESVNDIGTVQRNLQRTVEATEDDLAAQARQTRELQRDLLRTRMVEFEAIADRLYRVVRQASKDTGRPVKLDIEGGSIEVDRGVLDRMTPAFEHLLRNCVAHGIEEPAIRSAAGKDATGQIRIVLGHEGNDVSVEFRDDGAGLDLSRIRQRAVEQGLLPADGTPGDDEIAQLIFSPGFSTVTHVTELAGRGIGMDVVRADVDALGGRIEIDSRPGAGASFRLVLPLTTAVTQVVMLRSGQLSVGVPANLVEIVRRAGPAELERAYAESRFIHDGEELPFFWGGALLQSSARSAETGRSLPVVIFRSASRRVAVHVDEVLGSQEVVVKNLGPQLSRLPGLAGMSVLPSGAVVLIYNPVALAAVYGEQALQFSAGQPVAGEAGPLAMAAPRVPLVLVVDDSITVRRITQRLLQREGYRVALAADGLQALERLAEETPAVVLSDIEMPRMDGFDLARNIRGDVRWAELPIVMITSRIAEKHREHARQLGVRHYLGKPYSEDELLGLVRRYCAAALTTA
ncbi:Hpt domain-containing protein [Ramlibacter sp. AW1]|uniref:Chemotaxis protein CheA n=1 Tax=Ramlibacter aurantiacus TaxID=2801330 RepID=A0A936ZRA1_9BURK|nr:Hpt domain-containing protein [Ramlibacter aurantiacus]MBL0422170.1 Hpt domain-containing protein [Ramlibacter aurantiacus]